MSHQHLDRKTVLNLVYTQQATRMSDAYETLLADFSQMTAWGRGLESDLSHARVEISFLKAEVERLRYVGDGMAVMVGHIEVTGDAHRMMLELSREWEAAKEGKPSV
jgi:hypothetical protein